MSEDLSLAGRVKLNNGSELPRLHLGVYLADPDEAYQAVKWALEEGYRGVDSAQCYHNEKEVGKAIRDFLASDANSGDLTRDDIWFTTKQWAVKNYDRTRRDIKQSLKISGLDRIDLFLLHHPARGRSARLESWRAIEDSILEGEIRTGGVSNWGIHHLQELLDSKPRIVPAVNQIEVNPFNTRAELTGFCKKHGIVVEAYAPLAKAMRMKHPTIVDLSKKYGRTPGQILLQWSLQHGYVPLPKSVQRKRIAENGQVGDFEIDEKDMESLDGLDEYLLTDGWDPVSNPL